jgi:hypothetical protein
VVAIDKNMTLDSQFPVYHPVVFVDVEAHAGVARNKNHERPTMMKSMMVEISARHEREPKDCPTGKSDAPRALHLSSPFAKNISLRRLVEAVLLIRAVPPHSEGRLAIVRKRGAGCGGRGWRADECA